MSRDIKFRAWDLKEKVMRDVNEIAFTIGSITCKPLEGHDDTWEMYDPICFKGCYELMQYTGLKDKNGVEIYEGDVVKVSDPEGDMSYTTDVYWGGQDYPAFDLNFRNIPSEWYYESNVLSEIVNTEAEEIEVIGNIYENTELLN